IDLYLRRGFRHDHRALLSEKLAGVRQRLSEVSRRCRQDLIVWHLRREVISGSKFDTPAVLKWLGCDRHGEPDMITQLLRFEECRRPNSGEQVQHLISIRQSG